MRDAIKFIPAAVKLIGARLSNQVDDSAAGATELSCEVACHHAEFLYRIEWYFLPDAGSKQIHILRAIQQYARRSGPLTVDRESCATIGAAIVLAHIACRSHESIRVTIRICGQAIEIARSDDLRNRLIFRVDCHSLADRISESRWLR